MFLSADETAELTGYRYASRQIAWLREHGYLFEIGGDRRPKLLRSHVVARLGGIVEKQTTEPKLHLNGCGYQFRADIWLRICKLTRKIYAGEFASGVPVRNHQGDCRLVITVFT